jgi:hypothetical protein
VALKNIDNVDFWLSFYYYGMLGVWIVQTLKVKDPGIDFCQGNYSLRIVSGDLPAFFPLRYTDAFP